MYRQGDVMIVPCGQIPKKITELKPEHGRVVLAEGEVTGHFHAMLSDQVTMFRDDAMARFIDVKSEAKLTHDEHDTINVPKGVYRVIRQREYDPEAARRVAD